MIISLYEILLWLQHDSHSCVAYIGDLMFINVLQSDVLVH
jgi:hypothetical protein